MKTKDGVNTCVPKLPAFYVGELRELVNKQDPVPTARLEVLKYAQQVLRQLDGKDTWHKRAYLKVQLAMALETLVLLG